MSPPSRQKLNLVHKPNSGSMRNVGPHRGRTAIASFYRQENIGFLFKVMTYILASLLANVPPKTKRTQEKDHKKEEEKATDPPKRSHFSL
jgi:hypothetical protein